MNIGKLWFVVLLGAMPATALAQPAVSVDVSVGDSYDSTAPGVPVESVDVFYDQLAPYGVWVDEPQIGHVFIPQEESFVPYTNGHWQYTSVGFVWVASEPFAMQTSHYGRWSYSQPYARWVWLPDTQWGPSWVEWRQSGSDFGWAPLAPDVVVRTGYSAPIESWHYCGATHVLDVDITRYYEPRARVVEIHREARPMEHYATVSNVRVVVGPPAATLRQFKIEARPVKVDVKVTGRIASASEAHAQVVHAQERKPQLEAQNKQRVEANVKIREVQTKVAAKQPVEAKKPEPQPTHIAAKQPEPRTEAKKPEPQPTHIATKPVETKKPEPQPTHIAAKPVETKKPEPQPTHIAAKPEPVKPPVETRKPEPQPTHVASRPEPAQPRPEAKKPEPQRVEQPKPEAKPAEHAAKPTPPAGEKREPEKH